MITFELKARKPELFVGHEDFHNICVALGETLKQKKFLLRYYYAFDPKVHEKSHRLEITYKGVHAEPPYINHLYWNFKSILQKTTNLLEPISCVSKYSENDNIYQVKRPITQNTVILQKLALIKEVPSKYVCKMSLQFINSPVYIKGEPQFMYEKEQLNFCLFLQKTPKSPITGKVIDPIHDVVADPKLKQEIKEYFPQFTEKKLIEKKQSFFNALNKYNVKNNDKDGIYTAFRRAAYLDDINGLDALLPKVDDINKPDDNPNKKRTALHWAVLQCSNKTVARLVELGAKSNIPDAQGKTSIDYAIESENSTIRNRICILSMENNKKNDSITPK